MEAPLLTLPETAKRLHYSTRQVHRIIREGPTFPARRPGGRGHFKIDPQELEAWISKQPTWKEARRIEVEQTRPRRGRPALAK